MIVYIEVKNLLLEKIKALVKTQPKHKIKAFWSDNDEEFISKTFQRFLKDLGIEKQMSTPYRLEQNKLVKHANQAIVEMEKNMLHAHNLNKSFWAKIVANEVYTQN